MKISETLKITATKLRSTSTTPVLDAELLLASVLKVQREFFYTHSEGEFAGDSLFDELMARRMQGEPIAYILGKKEFWSLELIVTPAVLIPRPETELLVELALQKLDRQKPLKILDLGTGSGAIALALAHEQPHWEITAIDSSLAALNIAQQNAKQLGLKINFVCGDWFAPIAAHTFDAIISNPPYVAANDPHLPQLKYEPKAALVSGYDGLDALRLIIANAAKHLRPHGWLIVEHGFDQSAQVTQLMQQNGLHNVAVYRDLANHPRATIGEN